MYNYSGKHNNRPGSNIGKRLTCLYPPTLANVPSFALFYFEGFPYTDPPHPPLFGIIMKLTESLFFTASQKYLVCHFNHNSVKSVKNKKSYRFCLSIAYYYSTSSFLVKCEASTVSKEQLAVFALGCTFHCHVVLWVNSCWNTF